MSVGIFGRTHLFSPMAVILILVLAAIERTTSTSTSPFLSKGNSPAVDAIASENDRRELHYLPFDHTHINRPPPQTQNPTRWFEDEYYTDDGAISESMMSAKKDRFREERPNDETNGPVSLESQQALSSSATNSPFWRGYAVFFSGGIINIVLVWSFFF